MAPRSCRARARTACQRTYPDSLIVAAGETLTAEALDTEWPAFRWCLNTSDKGGWLPDRLLDRQDTTTVIRAAFDTTELSVEPAEHLEVEQEEGGWFWCRSAKGVAGWLPAAVVSPGTGCEST